MQTWVPIIGYVVGAIATVLAAWLPNRRPKPPTTQPEPAERQP
jgi:hypothetical protein